MIPTKNPGTNWGEINGKTSIILCETRGEKTKTLIIFGKTINMVTHYHRNVQSAIHEYGNILISKRRIRKVYEEVLQHLEEVDTEGIWSDGRAFPFMEEA